jgi:GntR family transcriptional regulator, transcriptional repressor for pyruvate dehydrogenase complex
MSDASGSRERGDRVSVRIAEELKASIRRGDLRPGDRLPPERQLAENFKVSRATAREALRTLEVMGLVEIRVGAGGTFVKSPGTDLISEGLTDLMMLSRLTPEEIAEARLLLEMRTVVLATMRATSDDIDSLRRRVQEMSRLLDEGVYRREDAVTFHTELARIAGNVALALLCESIRGPLSLVQVRRQEPEHKSRRRTVEEHEQIVEAMAAGDARQAQRAMTDHLVRGVTLHADAVEALCPEPSTEERPGG